MSDETSFYGIPNSFIFPNYRKYQDYRVSTYPINTALLKNQLGLEGVKIQLSVSILF